MKNEGWLINDCLTCIPNTKTLWHFLLDIFPNLVDKTNGYTSFHHLNFKIENEILTKKKIYVINIDKFHILLIKKISQLIFRIINFIS